jgi:hypothetical protein
MAVGTTKTGSYSTAFHTSLQMPRCLYPAGGEQLPSPIVPGSLEPVTTGGPLYLFILRHIFTPTTLQLRWEEHWPLILPNITISITLILILQSRRQTELTFEIEKLK